MARFDKSLQKKIATGVITSTVLFFLPLEQNSVKRGRFKTNFLLPIREKISDGDELEELVNIKRSDC